MPFPRVRFTVRRMMVAAAVVGALLGTSRLIADRSVAFLSLARDHEALRDVYDRQDLSWMSHERDYRVFYGGENPRPDELAEILRQRNRVLARSAHHGELARKYLAAHLRPWLPVVPDPPEPE